MFVTALFVIARTWKQPMYPSTKEWIRKMWYIYIMEYYIAEKNDILKFEGKWMTLENIILSEVSQTQKEKYHTWLLDIKQKKKTAIIHNHRELRQQLGP